jgi:hypothetical protein
MESFKTQFMMSGVRTYVTVEIINDNTFGCTLNLVDFYEGDEIPVNSHDYDLIIKSNGNNEWFKDGDAKVHLSQEDLLHLGEAINESLT